MASLGHSFVQGSEMDEFRKGDDILHFLVLASYPANQSPAIHLSA